MNNTSSLSRLGRIQFADVELAPPSVSASYLDCERGIQYTDTHVHAQNLHICTNGACLLIMCFLQYKNHTGRDNCVVQNSWGGREDWRGEEMHSKSFFSPDVWSMGFYLCCGSTYCECYITHIIRQKILTKKSTYLPTWHKKKNNNRKNKHLKLEKLASFKLHDAQCVISNQRDLSLQSVGFQSTSACIF